jgi:hypothetical protein
MPAGLMGCGEARVFSRNHVNAATFQEAEATGKLSAGRWFLNRYSKSRRTCGRQLKNPIARVDGIFRPDRSIQRRLPKDDIARRRPIALDRDLLPNSSRPHPAAEAT